MPEQEREVIKLKYAEKFFAALNPDELRAFAIAIIKRITIITGWITPETKDDRSLLYNELAAFLLQSWPRYNSEEVVYAIRRYGLTIKDWGRGVNLQLINEALLAYRDERQRASDLEERAAPISLGPGKELPVIENLGPVDWAPEWERVKAQARDGKIEDLFVSTAIYDWLQKQGKINLSDAEKWELMEQCKNKYIGEIEVALLTSIRTKTIADMLDALKNDTWKKSPDLKIRIANMAKIQAVKETAISEIMDEL